MTKYSGMFIPGDDDDGEPLAPSSSDVPPPSPLPPPRVFSAQFDEYRQREEKKARLAAWMKGHLPVESWDTYDAPYGRVHVLVMQFPRTPHALVFATEFATFGKVQTWCEGCRDTDCAACRWARAAYLTAMAKRRQLDAFAERDARLPF